MKKLNPEEMQALVAADGPTRYAHFIKQVADWQQVWGLRAPDGWVATTDDSGQSMFPVWPHAEYAALCAVGEWSDALPTSIDLDEWLEEWLVNLADAGDGVAVFPTADGKIVVIDPSQLIADIEDELAHYE